MEIVSQYKPNGVHKEVGAAFHLLHGVHRFKHIHFPLDWYDNTVSTHTVGVYSRTKSMKERYPKPNSINWEYAYSLGAHHDESEKFYDDRVVFVPIIGPRRRNQEIENTVRWLGQDPRIADMVKGFEDTSDMLKGKLLPISPRPREEIIVAVMDLLDAADYFHLTTVRQLATLPEDAENPIPIEALEYAPNMGLQYRQIIPEIIKDPVFNRQIRWELDLILSAVAGWWSAVPHHQIPNRFRTVLENLVETIGVKTRRGEPLVFA